MNDLSDTKKRILDVSLDLFSKNGYSGTSIRQIARSVGVSESAIYNHFKGKDKIIKTLFEIYGTNRAKEFISKIDKYDDFLYNPDEFLKSHVMDNILDVVFNDETNKFLKVVMMEVFCINMARDITSNEIIGFAKDKLSDLFQKMIERGVIKDYNPEVLANEFLAPLALINLEHLIKNNENNIDYYKRQIKEHIDFFWNSIKLK